jgi:chaperonin cofactor prefoldin
MEIFDELKEKCEELEDQIDALQNKVKDKDKRIGSL